MNDFASEEIDHWYEAVDADVCLTQGDIILDCPILRWASKVVEIKNSQEQVILPSLIEAAQADVIVMTQACDLEQGKVANVIVCPHISLEKYKEFWEKVGEKKEGKKPNAKQWTRTCRDLSNGYMWNLAMLNQGKVKELSLTHRVVDFHDVFTLPRTFLESLLQGRGQPRLRLRPPYREHLSQAFARFFMRVGLPTGITKIW
ncbi:hypothetical protein VB712_06435 [Spirulina sp. CCNP1310]|uniref:hypothetical protein n=1 Tax=Spirulina sp. CCNP1310 TaxID=3110249 RepID=UPI002B200F8F|nr:hypothetical protein [Spirulina sp. CCNP1310]MEA5418859.1 hypothetical protein [Spirulina sp. CCNP1310]